MALRDKLAARAQPYLEPGEQIQAVFMAQSGPSPYWSLLSYWIMLIAGGYAVFAVTDRAIIVLRASRIFPSKPKGLRVRLPRNTMLEADGALWGKLQLDQKYWVHRRFHKDLEQANAALQQMSGGMQPS